MKPNLRFFIFLVGIILAGTSALAQSYSVKAVLKDGSDKTPLAFATAAHSKASDKDKASAYTLSEENGAGEPTELKLGY